jgi:Putative transmembrane protein (PGPGW)
MKKGVNCLRKCIFKVADNMVDNLLITIEQLIPIELLINLTIISLVSFFASLIIIPVILVNLPHDYFDTRKARHWLKDHHPFLRILGLIIKNVSGSAFVISGFVMLFLPGQGILTMLIGLSLMDFPGKRQLEIKIIRQPTVLKTINTLRLKHNKLPLTLP